MWSKSSPTLRITIFSSLFVPLPVQYQDVLTDQSQPVVGGRTWILKEEDTVYNPPLEYNRPEVEKEEVLILNELGGFGYYIDSTELRLYLRILNDYQTFDYLRVNKEVRGPTSTFIQEYRKDYPHQPG